MTAAIIQLDSNNTSISTEPQNHFVLRDTGTYSTQPQLFDSNEMSELLNVISIDHGKKLVEKSFAEDTSNTSGDTAPYHQRIMGLLTSVLSRPNSDIRENHYLDGLSEGILCEAQAMSIENELRRALKLALDIFDHIISYEVEILEDPDDGERHFNIELKVESSPRAVFADYDRYVQQYVQVIPREIQHMITIGFSTC